MTMLYDIIHTPSGDRAEADTFEDAVFAARTLIGDNGGDGAASVVLFGECLTTIRDERPVCRVCGGGLRRNVDTNVLSCDLAGNDEHRKAVAS